MGKRTCFLCRVETKPLFEFPSDFETRAKWFKAIEHLCDTSTITDYSKLCFNHFEESCFRRGETRAFLIRKAVPTIFDGPNMPWHHDNIDMIKCCRETDKICQDSEKDPSSVEPVFLKTNELLDLQGDQDENDSTLSNDFLEKPYFRSVKTFMQGSRAVSDVCRICFRSSSNEDAIKLYEKTLKHDVAYIENMLKSVLPNLDLNVYAHNTICARCFEFLDYSYRLKNDWLLTEQKLQKILKTKRRKLNCMVDVVILMEDEEQNVANVAHDHSYDLKVENQMQSEKDIIEEDIISEDEKSTKKEGKRLRKKEGKHSSWGLGPYMCEICGCTYTHLKSFQRHIRLKNAKML
ncbi:hypothetical protein TcasGA2_TC033926 [Tribolium castaneum]|uniref:THAP-type domain-containing protein n=1 Tax=Tribolium castaneum TaxID=7070 RepID=A0A139WDL7_TRICA|nr:PREDICTED: uncharacterized protein LOC103314580 [Tribolium castaneum]KYB26026.1 hypothetical protein TcasGA2_TC033926 [Tribolium castaneum]|eukprot:XP_008199204.1 PREDICTED: uncharacterized protein LOC103314580 [Tribolium castaneum]